VTEVVPVADDAKTDGLVSGLRRRRGMQIAVSAMVLACVGAIAGLFTPLLASAWPWDDDRGITVSGRLMCWNIDSGSDLGWGRPRVEYFEIRGRTGVLDNSDPYNPSYSVTVPPGWKIEYFLKCSGAEVADGSFEVSKTVLGSGYTQNRTICNQLPSGFGPCKSEQIGGCVVLWVEGLIPKVTTFEDAISIWSAVFASPGGPSDIEACLRALTNTEQLSQQPPPTLSPIVVSVPPLAVETVPTLATVPGVATAPTAPVTAPPAAPVVVAPPVTDSPVVAPPPTTPPPPPTTPPTTLYRAQQASRGASTFLDPSGATGPGPRIEPNTWVDVSCKLRPATTIQSAYPDGYWYLIASSPWNNQYYAVANTFWNGDTPMTPRDQWHNTDISIPDC
jgi:hypothetical protein